LFILENVEKKMTTAKRDKKIKPKERSDHTLFADNSIFRLKDKNRLRENKQTKFISINVRKGKTNELHQEILVGLS